MSSPFDSPRSSADRELVDQEGPQVGRPLWWTFWLLYLPGLLLMAVLTNLIKDGFWTAWTAYQMHVRGVSLVQIGLSLSPGWRLVSLILQAAPFAVFFPWIIRALWRSSRSSRAIWTISAKAAALLGLAYVIESFAFEASRILRVIFP